MGKKAIQIMISLFCVLLMSAGCAQPLQEDAAADVPYVEPQEQSEVQLKGNVAVEPLPDEPDSEVKTPESGAAEEPSTDNQESITKKEEVSDTAKEDVSVSSEEAVTNGSVTPALEADVLVKERYDSLAELLNVAETGENTTNSVQSATAQTDLEKYYEYFYVPTGIPTGYALNRITVTESNIMFRYRSIENPDDYNLNITVTYDNPKRFTKKNAMQAAVDQLGISLTKEGYLYDSSFKEIIFPVGDSRMSIRVPESMNTYEQMKPLCVATRYEVNANNNTVTE